ncbi:MAG TPA: hypothetical protein ENF52_01660, partial [Chloroflexi bacterium]|nr:hypothetical protein [Chloroflexota bacterium]
IVDSDNYGMTGYQDTELISPPFDASALSTVMLEFDTDYYTYTGSDYADVDVSVDGGNTWVNVWQKHGASYRGPAHEVIDISALAAGQPDVRVRFHYYNAYWEWWWQVDNVLIGNPVCVPPTGGGLVVGNVYDANTGDTLTGAEVSNDSGESFVTQATDDPAVDDAFYTLFSPAGSHTFTATMDYYGTVAADVNVLVSDTVGFDFNLPAGILSVVPSGMAATLPMGAEATYTMTIHNSGGTDAAFELQEQNRGFAILGPIEDAHPRVKPHKRYRLTAAGLGLPEPEAVPPYAAGDVIQHWPTGLTYAWGVGFNLADSDLWLGDIGAGGGTDLAYRFLTDGTNTGDTFDISWAGVFAGDMTYNPNTGMLWVMDVGGDNCIHEVNPNTRLVTGNTICPAWTVSQRGLAYDPTTDTFFAGGWNDLMIYRFTTDGAIIAQVNTGLSIAGLAYNPDTQHLFVTDSPAGDIYVLDVADNYNNIGMFHPAGYANGAGLAIDCDGDLWAVDQIAQEVYEFESGETTTMCNFDVDWLFESPTAGSVTANGGQTSVNVTFDALFIDQPGKYYAQLKVDHDTPYIVANIPVTMTVLAPDTWGKVKGTVTSLGICDANPAPLEGAEVLLEANNGVTWTVTTDISGTYGLWLDETYSPLTITVMADEHVKQQVVSVTVSSQTSTTVDFDLRMDAPCLSYTPDGLKMTLEAGQSAKVPFTMVNDGAGLGEFQLVEENHGFVPVMPQGHRSPNGSEASIEKTPASGSGVADLPTGALESPLGSLAYATELLAANLVNFDTDNPGGASVIGNTGGSMYAGDFLNGDFSRMYAIEAGANNFVTIDTATGAVTVIGPVAPAAGQSWTGMAGDSTDGTLYASSTDCSNSTLYTIDPATGAATQIGAITNAPCIIGIAVNSQGEMYGLDIVNDNLVRIDKATGAGTVVGPVGFNANYAQGMDFDESTDTLYLAAYNADSGSPELRIADTATGNSVLVGAFPAGTEMDALSIATGGGAGGADIVPWLAEAPITGTVAADSSTPVEITFDAGVPEAQQPGEYYAQLRIQHNAPHTMTNVPVTLTVTAPGSWGKLTGVVESLGYCDTNPVPLEDAEVSIESALGANWLLTTDISGTYTLWVDEAYSPFTITVSADDHATTVITNVTVSAGMTTTQDVALRSLEPCFS